MPELIIVPKPDYIKIKGETFLIERSDDIILLEYANPASSKWLESFKIYPVHLNELIESLILLRDIIENEKAEKVQAD